VLSKEVLRLLDHALSALPQRQRSVVTMRDVCGMAAEEVCAALGISPASQRVLLLPVRQRVNRPVLAGPRRLSALFVGEPGGRPGTAAAWGASCRSGEVAQWRPDLTDRCTYDCGMPASSPATAAVYHAISFARIITGCHGLSAAR
jgi:hypothetical protein